MVHLLDVFFARVDLLRSDLVSQSGIIEEAGRNVAAAQVLLVQVDDFRLLLVCETLLVGVLDGE